MRQVTEMDMIPVTPVEGAQDRLRAVRESVGVWRTEAMERGWRDEELTPVALACVRNSFYNSLFPGFSFEDDMNLVFRSASDEDKETIWQQQ